MQKEFSILVFVGIICLTAGCVQKSGETPREGPQPAHQSGMVPGHEAGGVRWKIPALWHGQPPRQMRVATYTIPAPSGGGGDAECAVFFFGTGQGGGVESNIQRWVDQFENAPSPKRTEKKVNGIELTVVRLEGTFLDPSGPMMESQGKKEQYGLLGAIIQAPDGPVFFKVTGPSATVSATESDFNELLESITK